jgi:flavin reductase (DIM6/NTAB) family NADH-FMN oxidoreductase RutF
VIPLGSHDLFLGEVVWVHYSEEFTVNGRFDLMSADPMVYGFGNYYGLGELIGRHGETLR